MLVANASSLALSWMVLQEAAAPEGRRASLPLVITAHEPERFPSGGGGGGRGYDRVLVQPPCSGDASFRKSGAGTHNVTCLVAHIR